jgi:hypothetical protein
MRKATLPAGEDSRRTWRTINGFAPEVADAFAAAVWRYAETGEATPPEKVAPEVWADAQAEVERIEAARAAGRKAGASGFGESKARPGNQNAKRNAKRNENATKTQPTRGREDEDEDEDEEEDKNDNPKTEDEDAREARPVPSGSSVSGLTLKVSDSDMMRARMLAGEREAVEVALEWAGETGNALSRNTFAKACRRLGVKAFAEVVCAADAEARADGEPRKRGAALNRKLQNALAAALIPVEVAPAKVSPPPMRPAAVHAEPEPPPAVEEEGEEENPAPPFPALFASKRAAVAAMTPEDEEAERQRQLAGLARWKAEHAGKREEVTDG